MGSYLISAIDSILSGSGSSPGQGILGSVLCYVVHVAVLSISFK